jgi:hypothetical protein
VTVPGCAPKPVNSLTRLRLFQPRADRESFFRPSRRYQETGLSEKRNKMLTMWGTEDEHRLLLERCGVHSFLHGCARLLCLFLLVLVGAYISTKGHNMSLLTAMLKRAVFHSITGPRAGFFSLPEGASCLLMF